MAVVRAILRFINIPERTFRNDDRFTPNGMIISQRKHGRIKIRHCNHQALYRSNFNGSKLNIGYTYVNRFGLNIHRFTTGSLYV